MIRHFADADAAAVNRLYAACHPTWPIKPEGFWWAHPTLVLMGRSGDIIGATAMTLGLAPATELAELLAHNRAEVGWGHGVYVDPAHRGKGYGWMLADARHQALRALGAGFFLGMTQPDNTPMRAIFARQGLEKRLQVPNNYPDGQAAILYTGRIE